MTDTTKLRIGYVPEHFSAPLHFAQNYYDLDDKLIPFPSGTGHMIASLRSDEIDVAIGLTEGWVAGLGNEHLEGDGGYRLVGTYVETPLCWAISTGANRNISSAEDLRGSKCGVSRIGSGSYVMAYNLALQRGWLSQRSTEDLFQFRPFQTFEKLREAVNQGTADFFMWEYFTSKKYYETGEIKKIDEIYTPWPSWIIVASTTIKPSDTRLEKIFSKLDKGIMHFEANQEESVRHISTSLDYSEADARSWLETVKFSKQTRGVDLDVVRKTVDILQKAGVIGSNVMEVTDMVAIRRDTE